MKSNAANRFISVIRTVLSEHPNEADRILNAYGITEDTPDETATSSILNYINGIALFAPTLSFARGWFFSAFVYYFNEGNPWEGPMKGRANHILDRAYLFQNFREFLTLAQSGSGNRFCRRRVQVLLRPGAMACCHSGEY
ncbi:hypothetical protein N7474_000267 [Penicillium riverlandense]|uniref:uncharacterized protein n=1 Tax=Penicillium riverlandense TaxID=1903569 RepID=UPI002547A4EF|nr:uncharacterized protein N7474_000267 [Penicillium riverlandense]KAJ5831956.1 hypothetical protein N7474_000267 [Penicillium riverlandense]